MGKFKIWQESLFATFSGSVDPAGTAGATDVTGRLSAVETKVDTVSGQVVTEAAKITHISGQVVAISGAF